MNRITQYGVKKRAKDGEICTTAREAMWPSERPGIQTEERLCKTSRF